MDAVARLHIQVFDVRLDAHFAHLGVEAEVEIERVVLGNGGGIRGLPFAEEGKFQDQFFGLRIEISVLDGTRDDDFAFRSDGGGLFVCLASAKHEDGQNE